MGCARMLVFALAFVLLAVTHTLVLVSAVAAPATAWPGSEGLRLAQLGSELNLNRPSNPQPSTPSPNPQPAQRFDQAPTPTPVLVEPTLLRNYRVSGTNPNGSRYSGSAVITWDGAYYIVQWKVGRRVYAGRGTLESNILTVHWGDRYPVIYTVQQSGVLVGTWSNGRATDVLTPR